MLIGLGFISSENTPDCNKKVEVQTKKLEEKKNQ